MPVSPIEYAIENVEEKNKQLASAIEQHHHNPNLDIKNLGMLLNGSVDPAVQGGFANFKVPCLNSFHVERSSSAKKFFLVIDISLQCTGLKMMFC